MSSWHKWKNLSLFWQKVSWGGGVFILKMGCSFTTPPLLEPWKMIRNIDLPTGKVYLFIYQYFVWEKYPNLRVYKGIWAMWMAVLAGQGPRSRNIWILRLRKSRQEVYGVSLGADTSETFTTPCIFPQENLNSEEVWFNNKVGRITLLVVFGEPLSSNVRVWASGNSSRLATVSRTECRHGSVSVVRTHQDWSSCPSYEISKCQPRRSKLRHRYDIKS